MGGYIQAVGILFLILALLWGVVWLMRRYGRFNFLPRPGALPRDALVMEAQMPLGPRKGLMVVRFLNRRLLLGITDRQITLLTEEKAYHEPHGADFRNIMEQAKNDGPADRGLSSAGD
jgi:flagellar protein FliO/FliZ